MKPILLALLITFSLPSHAQLYELFQPHTYVNSGGDSLWYRLLEPSVPLELGERVPVVIFLHGSGERGRDNQAQLLHVLSRFVSRDMRNKFPCYVLAPQCPEEEYWTSGKKMEDGSIQWKEEASMRQKMIMEVLEDLLEQKQGDPARVYLGGLSMGGSGTWDMLAHYPDRFAAAFPVCARSNLSSASKIKDIPIWVFHGADDAVNPPIQSRQMVEALRDAGGSPIYTEFEGVKHNSWDPALVERDLLWDWLFSQGKKGIGGMKD